MWDQGGRDVNQQSRHRGVVLAAIQWFGCHCGMVLAAIHYQRRALSICRITQAGQNVLFLEIGKLVENFLVRHARCEIIKHIVNSYSHPSNARLAASLSKFNGNNIFVALCSPHVYLQSPLIPKSTTSNNQRMQQVQPYTCICFEMRLTISILLLHFLAVRNRFYTEQYGYSRR